MKVRSLAVLFCTLVVGLIGGWFGKAYFDTQANRALSVLAIGQAHEAMRVRDDQQAIYYAIQATLADPTSYLAQLNLAEIYEQAGHRQIAVRNYERALDLLRFEPGGANEEAALLKKIEQIRASVK